MREIDEIRVRLTLLENRHPRMRPVIDVISRLLDSLEKTEPAQEEQRDTGITCPRRMHEWGPWQHEEGHDSWRADNTCSFCGSLNPQEVLGGIKADNITLEPTDKNYKVYVQSPTRSGKKCYFQHFSKEQQAEFIELLNARKIKFATPGFFYVKPFFITYEKPEEGVAPITSGLTDDPADPRLKHGTDAEPVPQNEVYLVLSEEERAKGFVRPLRRSYRHVGPEIGSIFPLDQPRGCGSVTDMGLALCETYARDPKFYGSTYCVYCQKHLPVTEFVWVEDGKRVGS